MSILRHIHALTAVLMLALAAGRAAAQSPADRAAIIPDTSVQHAHLRRPAYLQAGDTVAVVSTSGRVSDDFDTLRVQRLFDSWGLHTKFGRHATDTAQPYFAGTDSQRASDLQQAIDDPSVKAVIACRGGYGAVRLLPEVDFGPLFIHPKWIVGFSDITLLHLVMQRAGIESIHGPMPATFGFDDEGCADPSAESLREALFGELQRIEVEPHPLNRTGHAEGRLAGGNLMMLCSAAGTPEALRCDEPTVLFVEEVGEAAYRIDRMMQQLLRSGALDNVTAIVAGYLTDTKYMDTFGVESPCEIIDEYARLLGIPALYGLPAGHELPNTALYLGRRVQVDITDDGASITFIED